MRDVEALAFCMRQGANQQVIERFLHNPLSAPQRELLLRVVERARPVAAGGLDVLVAAVAGEAYVEGVSLVVHKAMDVANCDALVLLVEMERRVFVTARSRVAALDVAEVLKAVGGGGHAAAASAIVKDMSLATARRRVVAALKRSRAAVPTAAALMSEPVRWVTAQTTVDAARITCERYGYGGLSVADGDTLVGSVSRRDLDRAVRHKLGHAPVKAVMTTATTVVAADTAADELTNVLARDPVGRVLVVRTAGVEPVTRSDVVGVVTRSDVLRALHAGGETAGGPAGVSLAEQLATPRPRRPVRRDPGGGHRLPRRLPGRRGGARPAARRARGRHRHRRRGRRHRVRAGARRPAAVAACAPTTSSRRRSSSSSTAMARCRRCASTSPRPAPSSTTIRRRCPRSSTPPSAATSRGATSRSTPWPCR